jgi:hypothetical protein
MPLLSDFKCDHISCIQCSYASMCSWSSAARCKDVSLWVQ